MTIDVLIPCYNSERFIERALASVLGQTRPADRVVLHDDASTDGTAELLSRLEALNPSIRVLRSAGNLGILGARQRLVAETEGDVVCFLDHDDAWPPDYLASVCEAMDNDRVVATIAPARNIDERGREVSYERPGAAPLRASMLEEGVRSIFLEYPVPTWSCLAMRRTAARRLSSLEGFHSGEEFALLALALEHGDVEFLPGPAVQRHVADTNASRHARKQHEAELAILGWFATRYPSLWTDVPSKVAAIYANSVYRYTVTGDVRAARASMAALLRGIFHRKVPLSFGALLVGRRLLRWIRPVR